MGAGWKINTSMMAGETELATLLKGMKPVLNSGEYVFCTVEDISQIGSSETIATFREKEGITVIIDKKLADQLSLPYSFVASWITLTIHSSLEAVGLTAAFSKALADENISCNVVAAYYHDHLFVLKADEEKATEILKGLSRD